MKWLVWFLILLNLGLLAYFQLDRLAGDDGLAGHAPLQADRLTLLPAEAARALDQERKTVAAIVEEPPACYVWSGVSDANLSRARYVLEQLGLNFSVQQAAVQEPARYWVYIPQLSSPQEAQERASALRKLGVRDIFVVQDARWRNAISLGIFKEAASAERLAQELRTRGVADAESGAYGGGDGRNRFLIERIPASRAEEISRLKPDFPTTELAQADCE